jgi:hypothetical protein
VLLMVSAVAVLVVMTSGIVVDSVSVLTEGVTFGTVVEHKEDDVEMVVV